MTWAEIKQSYPNQWLVIEALQVHEVDNHRIFDDVAIVAVCDDGLIALKTYGLYHDQYPEREFAFIRTSYPELKFKIVRMGVWSRRHHAINP